MEYKKMEDKWEELFPYKEQMKIWATHENVADGGHPANEQLVMSKDKKKILHKVLKTAYEQMCRLEEGDLKLKTESYICSKCKKELPSKVMADHYENLSKDFGATNKDALSEGDLIQYASQMLGINDGYCHKTQFCNGCWLEVYEGCERWKDSCPKINLKKKGKKK